MKKTFNIHQLLVIFSSIVFALVALCGLGFLYFTAPKTVVIETQGQPTIGGLNAAVHVVVFEDLKCADCRDYTTTIYPKIKQKYIDTGKVKYTMITMAFMAGSRMAALAAKCVYEQNKDLFFPFVDYLFENQPKEFCDWATLPNLEEFARKVPGVDVQALREKITDANFSRYLDRNFEIGKQAMENDILTPTLFVNGVRVKEPKFELICKEINAALARKGIYLHE
jgi:protein-disulfide isomerase